MHDLIVLPAAMLLVSAVVSGFIAAARGRSSGLWAALGILLGPVAVAIVWCVPARRVPAPPIPARSLVDEIAGLQEMRERGLIDDAEFARAKAKLLA